MKIICKQCHQEFELTDADIKFFTSRNLNIPKRCKRCRDINKRLKNQSSVSYEESSEDTINFYKRMTIIIVLAAISIMVSIFFYVKSTETSSSRYTPPSTYNSIAEIVAEATTSSTAPTIIETSASTTCTPPATTAATTTTAKTITYYLNTYRHKFHRPDCESVQQMNYRNRKAFYGTREEAIEKGYSPCHNCNP